MITVMNKSILLFFLSILAFSCNSSDDSSSAAADDGLTNVPEAKAEFDDSNFGVYKGIFVGSSGIVYVNINNTGSVSAKLTIQRSCSQFHNIGKCYRRTGHQQHDLYQRLKFI